MKRVNGGPTNMRAFVCPQCDKQRMIRPCDYVVSLKKQDHKTRENNTVSLFIDICDFCKRRNFSKYFEPTKADIKKAIRAIQSEAEIEEGQSLEDLL